MATWIFQCNPDHYDIDGLLASSTRDILFAANQNASRMSPGDAVYVWRSKGKKRAEAGIVAKGRLTDRPRARPDTGAGSEFWVNPVGARESRPRVSLHIEEIANRKEIIQRSWLMQDPVLSELTILKMANMSNYAIIDEQEQRSAGLWDNTGVDWSRADTIAALRVYQQTYGGSLSLLPGSPIAETAVLIGRVVKGVYNKVLNFRHIDPRDDRAGFSGGGMLAREIWEEFFDLTTQEIDTDRLEAEFHLLFGSPDALIGGGSEAATPPHDGHYSYRPGPVPHMQGHVVSAKHHSEWFVYVLTLDKHETVKVGHSYDPKVRLKAYNRAILTEITKLEWKLAFTHKVADAQTAQNIEQAVLQRFSGYQLASNGEVLQGITEPDVRLAIIEAARSQPTPLTTTGRSTGTRSETVQCDEI
ncbi:EVE domain-containing protein [Thioclava sp.]|uniref:EVE domain-containing protein n=1 Tax=Thioclava sp. TaxID=1933450 RepID=UPI003242DBB1